ncbi:MAG: hypothetical protein Q7S81_03315, partial [bacterium]|nr:hypothetical protein [bacterium]
KSAFASTFANAMADKESYSGQNKNMDLTQLLNKELGLENLSQEEKEKIISRFGESLLKRMIFRIFKLLSEQDRKNLEALQGGEPADAPSSPKASDGRSKAMAGKEEKINKFLTEKVPNLENIKEEELNLLINDFKEFSKNLK